MHKVYGGSAWESNPPTALLRRYTGFEDPPPALPNPLKILLLFIIPLGCLFAFIGFYLVLCGVAGTKTGTLTLARARTRFWFAVAHSSGSIAFSTFSTFRRVGWSCFSTRKRISIEVVSLCSCDLPPLVTPLFKLHVS